MGIDDLSDGLDPAEGPETDAIDNASADAFNGGLETHRMLLLDAPTPDPADDLDANGSSGRRS